MTGIDEMFTFWLEFDASSVMSARTAFCVPALTLVIGESITPSVAPVVVTPVTDETVGVAAVNWYVAPDGLDELIAHWSVSVSVVFAGILNGVSKVNVLLPDWMVGMFAFELSAVPLFMSWQFERYEAAAPFPAVNATGMDEIEYVPPLVPESVIVPSVAVVPAVGVPEGLDVETLTVLAVCAEATPANKAAARNPADMAPIVFHFIIFYLCG